MGGGRPGDAVLALPAGSVDPCLIDPAALPEGTSLEGLAGTHVTSTSPPWLEGTYRNVNSGPIDIATLSPGQLAASIDGLSAESVLREIPEQVGVVGTSSARAASLASSRPRPASMAGFRGTPVSDDHGPRDSR